MIIRGVRDALGFLFAFGLSELFMVVTLVLFPFALIGGLVKSIKPKPKGGD